MPFVTHGRLEDFIDEDAPARACRDIAADAGEHMKEETRRFTPISEQPAKERGGRAPGTLRASIHRTDVEHTTRYGRMAFRVRVRTEDPIAPYVEWNTKPHVIRPRRDRRAASVIETQKKRGTVRDGRASLSWVSGGVRHFAKVVHHPGTTGAHMFATGATFTAAALDTVAAPALRRFARDIVRDRRL